MFFLYPDSLGSPLIPSSFKTEFEYQIDKYGVLIRVLDTSFRIMRQIFDTNYLCTGWPRIDPSIDTGHRLEISCFNEYFLRLQRRLSWRLFYCLSSVILMSQPPCSSTSVMLYPGWVACFSGPLRWHPTWEDLVRQLLIDGGPQTPTHFSSMTIVSWKTWMDA